MKCDEIQEQLLENILSETDMVHLSACADCRSFQQTLYNVNMVVKNGLNSIEVPPFVKQTLPARKPNRRYAVVAAVVLFAFIISLPYVSPGIARQLEKVPLLYEMFYRDTGLVDGFEQSEEINYSVTDQGITFTIHNLITDSIRMAAVISIEGAAGREVQVKWPGYPASSTTTGMKQTDNGYVGYLEISSPPPKHFETLSFNLKVDGVKGDWKLTVPIQRLSSGEVTYQDLTSEKNGFKLVVRKLTFDITGTSLNWSVFDQAGIEGKKGRGYLETRIDWGMYLDLQTLHIELLDKNGTPIKLIQKDYNGGTGTGLSGSLLYPPVVDRQGLRVRARGFVVADTNPLQVKAGKMFGSWFPPTSRVHGTIVRWEHLNIGQETTISLSYQHGRLIDLQGLYLTDSQGNRYELLGEERSTPDYETELTKIYQNPKLRESMTRDTLYSSLRKHHKLRFEPLPPGVNQYSLHAETVLYKSDTVLELRIPKLDSEP